MVCQTSEDVGLGFNLKRSSPLEVVHGVVGGVHLHRRRTFLRLPVEHLLRILLGPRQLEPINTAHLHLMLEDLRSLVAI